MHEELLSHAVLPAPPRLLRLPLRPFSLGHELHLWRRANPYINLTFDQFDDLPAEVRRSKTFQVIHVCHQDFYANCKPTGSWRWWDWLNRRANLEEVIVHLRSYLLAGRQEFEAKLPSGDNVGKVRFLGAPEILRLYQFVCDTVPEREIAFYSRGHLTAWDYPLALAKMHFQTRTELAGGLDIYSFKDKAHDDYVAEQKAREAAAGQSTLFSE